VAQSSVVKEKESVQKTKKFNLVPKIFADFFKLRTNLFSSELVSESHRNEKNQTKIKKSLFNSFTNLLQKLSTLIR